MDKEDIVTPIPAQCTMKQYEALDDTEFTQYRDFTISDYPSDGANATQMAFALTCNRLFPEGTIIMFSGDTDDNYTKGHCYQVKVTDEVKSWVDITPVSEQTIPLLVGTQEKPILFSNIATSSIYVLKGYLKLKDNTTQNLDRPLLCQRIWGNKILIWNAQILLNGVNLQYMPGTMVILDINADVYTTFHNLSPISTLNGSILNNTGRFADFYAPTEAGTSGQILKSNGSNNAPTWIDYPISTITNTTVSSWVEDTTYTDFGYKADITITNLKETDICEVIFSQTDASSGNYAQINSSSANTLTIYSKVNSEITIPTIMVLKGGN